MAGNAPEKPEPGSGVLHTPDGPSESSRPPWGKISRAASIGIEFVVCICIGLIMGLWFDSIFNSNPYGILTGLGIGIASAFYTLFRMIGRLHNQ
ncbi:AtpZ/AtpI family protein [bacterium]|nr:AtpZ/AtpI family protein [candidate division CSSED10-310 bacterium]